MKTLSNGCRVVLAVLSVCASVQAQDVADSAAAQPTQDAAAPSSQLRKWTLADRPYYDPLVADPRAARIMLLVPAYSKQFPNSVVPGNRISWAITAGRELPMIGWSNDDVAANQHVGTHRVGFGLWVPVSFHMIEDMQKDESNPIIDTDYRFGAMLKFETGLTSHTWLQLKFVPWAHESTHLGDEYTIHAIHHFPDFERVNVSFEYYEYGVSLLHQFNRTGSFTVRTGGIQLWGPDGYYATTLLDSNDTPTLTQSHKNFEPSAGFEVRFPGIDSHILVSIDARDKLAYRYHQLSPDDEQRHWSASTAVGWARDSSHLRSVFLYYYYGVNPYGQLRSQEKYWVTGLGFTFQ